MRPIVSVVICTHNRRDLLEQHLPMVIESARLSPWVTEVVVVDNAPVDDRTRAVVDQTEGCRYVLEPMKGLSRARQKGIMAAQGSVILFVDDDVHVPPNWVFELARPLVEGRSDLVAGRVVPGVDRAPPWMGDAIRSSLAIGARRSDHIPLIGAAFGCTRAVTDAVQFNLALGAGGPCGSGEDILFHLEATALGFHTVGCDTAPAVHNFDLGRLERAQLRKAAEAIGRSDGYIAYHWLRSEIRSLRARLLVDRVRLLGLNLRARGSAGMTDAEWLRRVAIAHKRRLLSERTAGRRDSGKINGTKVPQDTSLPEPTRVH